METFQDIDRFCIKKWNYQNESYSEVRKSIMFFGVKVHISTTVYDQKNDLWVALVNDRYQKLHMTKRSSEVVLQEWFVKIDVSRHFP